MSRKKLIIGGVVAVVVLAAIASAAPKNEPAGSLGTASPRASAAALVDPTNVATTPEPQATAVTAAAYTVGDRIKLAEEEYFGVSEVDLDVPGSDFIKPDAGNKWIAALVEIEGINPDGASYNPFYFKVKDTEGFEYNFSAFGKEPSLQSSNDLKPGQKVKGWVTFEVPDEDATLTLTYTPGFLGEPVEVVLN